MKTYAVIWTLPAIAALRDIYNFIKSDSVEGAKNVATELVALGNSLTHLPSRNPVEKLLTDEPIVYRSAVKWNYKIIYTIEKDEVMVVDIFDTRRDPRRLKYEFQDPK
ncbi:MAG: type II toxin-antitoxin system RelE/ParE family toxin [Phycisphaerae bacterium]|nr:type II toxin-antitoxin system RelE/ParE family toxin [Saprospiraceae bacterium]